MGSFKKPTKSRLSSVHSFIIGEELWSGTAFVFYCASPMVAKSWLQTVHVHYLAGFEGGESQHRLAESLLTWQRHLVEVWAEAAVSSDARGSLRGSLPNHQGH